MVIINTVTIGVHEGMFAAVVLSYNEHDVLICSVSVYLRPFYEMLNIHHKVSFLHPFLA